MAWKRKPKLGASCSKESPWTSRTPIIVTDNQGAFIWKGECYYIRLKVENSGKTRAEKVQVYASSLLKQGADGKFVEISTFIPLNLKWSNLGVTVLDGISPKMGAFCDVIALCDPANPTRAVPPGTLQSTPQTIAELQLEVAPFTGSHLLVPGTYKLLLRIAAANALPVQKTFHLTHTGTWMRDDVDMRRDGIGLALS